MTRSQRKTNSPTVSRRSLIKTAGGVAVTAAGLAAWAGKAPALAQTRQLRFLLNSNFRPPFDVEIKKLAQEYRKLSGVEVLPEFIMNNDVPGRLTAAVESGTGMDLSVVQWNQAHIYADGLADVGDIVSASGGDKIYPWLRAANQVDGVFRAFPWYVITSAPVYNKAL